MKIGYSGKPTVAVSAGHKVVNLSNAADCNTDSVTEGREQF